jgi:hypothetical protein
LNNRRNSPDFKRAHIQTHDNIHSKDNNPLVEKAGIPEKRKREQDVEPSSKRQKISIENLEEEILKFQSKEIAIKVEEEFKVKEEVHSPISIEEESKVEGGNHSPSPRPSSSIEQFKSEQEKSQIEQKDLSSSSRISQITNERFRSQSPIRLSIKKNEEPVTLFFFE